MRTLTIPAKAARKKMKICWLLRLAPRLAWSTFPARSFANVPPSHQSLIACQYGIGDVERDVVLPVPDREADQEVHDEADEEPHHLLDGRREDVHPPHAADVDHEEAGQDHDRPDRPGGVDEVLKEQVRRQLLWELRGGLRQPGR